MQWKVKIEVTLKKGVLDPQGAAVEGALQVLDYHNVSRVRVGKYMELLLETAGRQAAAEQVEEMCRRLLTNPVIEDFGYTLQEVR
ncbi:MAG: phosphoribosylformylglycinamidine synthase subunit PurS [Bacillota bacterium]